jgi:hypothetical protein
MNPDTSRRCECGQDLSAIAEQAERLVQATASGARALERSAGNCSHCGGRNIVTGLKLGLTAEVGSVGPAFRAAWILRGNESLYIDLCGDCGTVTRAYVKETDKNWIRE